jgi:predicted RNase H-like HicB family nuclease
MAIRDEEVAMPLDRLASELASQRERIEALEARDSSNLVQIHTFAPEPYTVKKPIPIVVRPHDGEFLASFLDANVSSSGETEQEAFEGVKTLILDMLDQLQRQPKLGPKLAHRLAVLQEFIDGPQRA